MSQGSFSIGSAIPDADDQAVSSIGEPSDVESVAHQGERDDYWGSRPQSGPDQHSIDSEQSLSSIAAASSDPAAIGSIQHGVSELVAGLAPSVPALVRQVDPHPLAVQPLTDECDPSQIERLPFCYLHPSIGRSTAMQMLANLNHRYLVRSCGDVSEYIDGHANPNLFVLTLFTSEPREGEGQFKHIKVFRSARGLTGRVDGVHAYPNLREFINQCILDGHLYRPLGF